MQTKTRHKAVSSKTGGNINPGEKPFQLQTGNRRRQRKASTPSGVSGNGFLKTIFESIPVHEIGLGLTFTADEILLLKDTDPDYIVRTANNVMRLLGKESTLCSSGVLDRDCFNAYNLLKDDLPARTEHYFEFNEGQFSIYLNAEYRYSFPDYRLFFLPICGVDKMSDKLSGVFKKFIAYYSVSQRIGFPYIHWDFSYMLEDQMEMEEDEEDLNEEFRDTVLEYNSGHICDIFKEIDAIKVTRDELKKELNDLECEHYEQDLVELMREGVDLLSSGSITTYGSRGGGDGFDFARIFCIVWKDDALVDAVTENMNVDLQEQEDNGPCSITALTPESTELEKDDNYPTLYAEWYLKIYNVLGKYE